MNRCARARGLVALMLVGAAIAACSASTSPSDETETPSGTFEKSAGQGTIGAGGGQVATADGTLVVNVPPGALSRDTRITITEMQSPASGAIGPTYDIGPSGTQFAVPVKLTFSYAKVDLQGTEPSLLEAATIVDGDWVALASGAVDSAAQVVSGQTMHLSPYGIHAKRKGGTDGGPHADATSTADVNVADVTADGVTSTSDASGADADVTDATSSDATITDATTATDASAPDANTTDATTSDAGADVMIADAGSSDAAVDSGIQDAAADAMAACTYVTQQVGSCANHPVQICQQGKVFTNCVNLNPMGYAAYCCPAGG